jgi:hypothetical protein
MPTLPSAVDGNLVIKPLDIDWQELSTLKKLEKLMKNATIVWQHHFRLKQPMHYLQIPQLTSFIWATISYPIPTFPSLPILSSLDAISHQMSQG